MKTYQALISEILAKGVHGDDRTGTGTVSRFGMMLEHDMADGFPALTTKKLAFKTMAGELACFVKGLTDVREFHKRGCHIWDANLAAYLAKHPPIDPEDQYDLGPIYGKQWRSFDGVDQMRQVITEARVNPTSRRLVVSAWNPAAMGAMVLPPCHYAWQMKVRDYKYLDLVFVMRSVDVMIGLPFDLASYALLQCLIANELKLVPGRLIGQFGDAHVYNNHLKGAYQTLEREPFELPDLLLHCEPGMPVEQFEPEMAELIGYQHHPAIKMEMSV
jgi:thymidylate synthase